MGWMHLGLPDAFSKNTGHWSTVPDLICVVISKQLRENREREQARSHGGGGIPWQRSKFFQYPQILLCPEIFLK